MKKRSAGFTITELMVVIAIVLILSVVMYVAINPLEALKRRRNTRRVAELADIKVALDTAVANASDSAVPPFIASASGSSCTGTLSTDGSGWVSYSTASGIDLGRYMPTLPKDPLHPNACYVFTASGDGKTYQVTAVLEQAGDASTVMNSDSGNDATMYEVGTNPSGI